MKEKLSKEYVFTEDVTEYRKRMKFALPAAKAGSVIFNRETKGYDPIKINIKPVHAY